MTWGLFPGTLLLTWPPHPPKEQSSEFKPPPPSCGTILGKPKEQRDDGITEQFGLEVPQAQLMDTFHCPRLPQTPNIDRSRGSSLFPELPTALLTHFPSPAPSPIKNHMAALCKHSFSFFLFAKKANANMNVLRTLKKPSSFCAQLCYLPW